MPKSIATYEARAENLSSEVARQLCRIIVQKSSNLCVGVDLTKKAALLKVVDAVGPHVCLIKTHIDIVEDFDQHLIAQLEALAAKHNFMFFEDRKFADIGNTVKLQYSSGVYRIASWAHIVNAHSVPGEGIISGLASVGLPLNRGLLLLAEMSSSGSLATGTYTDKVVEMARKHKDFVMGFIAQRRVHETVAGPGKGQDDFLILSPGVGLDSRGDSLGQNYRTPQEVIKDSGCDVIIVGRGVYGKGEDMQAVAAEAKRYQEAGWQAYLSRNKA